MITLHIQAGDLATWVQDGLILVIGFWGWRGTRKLIEGYTDVQKELRDFLKNANTTVKKQNGV